MKIPLFWTKETYTGTDPYGGKITCLAYGSSLKDLAEAKQDAAERARRIFDYLIKNKEPRTYDYSERPLREEIKKTLQKERKDVAVITRNRYGALILNTASVCFADVDFPNIEPRGLIDAVLLLFSSKRREQRRQESREATVKRVGEWAGENPNRSFRVYRTFAGLRLLFTDRLYNPASSEVADLFSSLGVDMLYRMLTEKQGCFRARLTPKPWRCKATNPPSQFPWEDERDEQIYRQWESDYKDKASGYTTCKLLKAFGKTNPRSEIKEIMEMHDRWACGDMDAPLA